MVEVIYFDYQATTPIDSSVLSYMSDVSVRYYGNAHSSEHGYGWRSHDLVEEGRLRVRDFIMARRSSDIIFTSGATESNNLAIKGIGLAHKRGGGLRNRILVNSIEHKCALESALSLRREGFIVELLPMGPSGVVSVDDISERLGDDVLLLVLQLVNNELGTIQPIGVVSELCLSRGVLLHCDAAQASGRVVMDVSTLSGISSLSLSGHKMYGPKGVGALYLRSRPSVSIEALFDGGGQERGLRSGTLAVPLIAGFGMACDIAGASLISDNEHAEGLRVMLLEGLESSGVDFSINGDMESRISANLNLNLRSVTPETFFHRIKGIAVSAGSACSSGDSKNFSHVLRAIGVEESDSSTHVRLTIGRPTTRDDIKVAIETIAKATQL